MCLKGTLHDISIMFCFALTAATSVFKLKTFVSTIKLDFLFFHSILFSRVCTYCLQKIKHHPEYQCGLCWWLRKDHMCSQVLFRLTERLGKVCLRTQPSLKVFCDAHRIAHYTGTEYLLPTIQQD